ncbi:hypothetical protein [Ureibacillus sinduriensis]|uniref:hypothetical protein n=1 Tax=Ureibacillus sinduriensis TaxID=561440 RepID=UPI00068FF4DA|nr:hypothetical protein [Ureibacillus sinduriensis]
MKDELEKSIPVNVVKLSEKEKSLIRYRVSQSQTSKIYIKPIIVLVLFMLIATIVVLPNTKLMDTADNSSSQIAISLTERQKQQYYKEYVRIVDKAMEQKVGIGLSVPPIEEFKESDWIPPEAYEKMIQEHVDEFLATERKKIAAMSSDLKPAVTTMEGQTKKAVYLYFPDILKRVEVTANFDTQYSKKLDRQLFVAADNVSSKLVSSPGTWEQTSYEVFLGNDGQQYTIRIEGIFTLNNLSFDKAFTIQYICDEFGNIR